MSVYTIEHGCQKEKNLRVILAIAFMVIITITVIGYFHSKSSSSQNLSTQLSDYVAALPEQQQKLITPLPWPEHGQAAYGVVEEGVLAKSSQDDNSVPVASLAKIITALAVLKKKPLALGEQGPSISLTKQDEELYRKYLAKNGTVVPVKAGQQISQYQALQAMLMTSSNNMADTLAIWSFGSVENYNIYANNLLVELGFSKTYVADATGFSPTTQSTASEMVNLGILYIQNPVLREIAGQTKANIPFAGVINNYNSTINKDGIIGLKIGYTDEAGRAFLVADFRGNNINKASIVAVIGADSLPLAMKDASNLLKQGNIKHDSISKKS